MERLHLFELQVKGEKIEFPLIVSKKIETKLNSSGHQIFFSSDKIMAQ